MELTKEAVEAIIEKYEDLSKKQEKVSADDLKKAINYHVMYGLSIWDEDISMMIRMLREACEAYAVVSRKCEQTERQEMFEILAEKILALEQDECNDQFTSLIRDMYNGTDKGEYGELIRLKCISGHWLGEEGEQGPIFICD